MHNTSRESPPLPCEAKLGPLKAQVVISVRTGLFVVKSDRVRQFMTHNHRVIPIVDINDLSAAPRPNVTVVKAGIFDPKIIRLPVAGYKIHVGH